MVPNESFVLFPYNTAKHRLAKLVVKGRSIMLTFPTVSSRVAWMVQFSISFSPTFSPFLSDLENGAGKGVNHLCLDSLPFRV